jgi:hypothetical protein
MGGSVHLPPRVWFNQPFTTIPKCPSTRAPIAGTERLGGRQARVDGLRRVEHRAVRRQHQRHVLASPQVALAGVMQHVRGREFRQQLHVQRTQHPHAARARRRHLVRRRRVARQRVRERRVGRVHRRHPHRLVRRDPREHVAQQRVPELVGHVHLPRSGRSSAAPAHPAAACLAGRDGLERRPVPVLGPRLPAARARASAITGSSGRGMGATVRVSPTRMRHE